MMEPSLNQDDTVVSRYHAVRQMIDAAAIDVGRDPLSVNLLSVSKTFPASDIQTLYHAGVRAFGENRIPELESKAAQLPGDIEWHFIGQLQANKVRRAVRLAACIHSVDSLALLERIDRIAGEENRCPGIFIEINSGEESKSGCHISEAPELVLRAAGMAHVKPLGLMTMSAADATEAEQFRTFEKLAVLQRELVAKGVFLPDLSMGMSGDFKAAIAAGSTWVRIGTAIFGGRS